MMTPQVFKEFAVSINTVIAPPDENCPREQRSVSVVVQRYDTGERVTKQMYHLNAEILVENVILTKFADTTSAEHIRRGRGQIECTLVPNWDIKIGSYVHTALRKLCDTSASTLWWNIIEGLPSSVWSQMNSHSITRINEVTAHQQVKYRNALKAAWYEVLRLASRLQLADSRSNAWPHKEDAAAQSWDIEELFEDMTRREQREFDQVVKMAYLSLDFLSDDDWDGMLGYMVEYTK